MLLSGNLKIGAWGLMHEHLTLLWLCQATLVFSEDSFDTPLAVSGCLLVIDKQDSDISTFPPAQMNAYLDTAEYGRNTHLLLCGIFVPTRSF